MVSSYQCDLAVIGGGLAGLVGALRAAELGARVKLFEVGTATKYPANSRYTGGVFHVAFQDIHSPVETLVAAISAATGGFANAALAHTVATHAGRAADWLQAQGAEFGVGGPFEFMRCMLKPFSLQEPGFSQHWPDRGADRLLAKLEQKLLNYGGDFIRGARARGILMHQGRCAGLEIERQGKREKVESAAVLIADGGFQGNPDLVRRYISPRPEALCQRWAGTGYGDGLLMAEAVGAKLLDLGHFYGHVQCAEAVHNDALWPYPILDIVASAGIVVNGLGRRFTDEGLGGVALANAVAALDDPLSSYVVMDAAIWEQQGKEFLLPPNPTIEQRGVPVIRAATLPELAVKLRMPTEALMHTVNHYNDALAAHTSEQLDPPRTAAGATLSRRPMEIVEAPFVAVRLSAGMTYTMGGIATDGEARVLDQHDHPITGLFAAGSATAGLEGGPLSGYVGGLAKALVFGLIAAEESVELINHLTAGASSTERSESLSTHGVTDRRIGGTFDVARPR